MNQLLEVLVIAVPALALLGIGIAVLPRRAVGPGAAEQRPDVPEATAAGAGTVVLEPVEPEPIEPLRETPEPVAGRLVRLRERLARSGSPLGTRLLTVLSRDHLTEVDWDEIEEALLLADVGAGPSAELVGRLRERVRVLGVRDPAAVRALLRERTAR